jgi:hypothetical protein
VKTDEESDSFKPTVIEVARDGLFLPLQFNTVFEIKSHHIVIMVTIMVTVMVSIAVAHKEKSVQFII